MLKLALSPKIFNVPKIISKLNFPFNSNKLIQGDFMKKQIDLMGSRNIVTIIPQYMEGVRMNFGKLGKILQPGLRLKIPIYHQVYKVDMREDIVKIPKQSLVSADNVTIHIDASVQYKVVDAKKSVLNVSNVEYSLTERCQMQLRNLLSSMNVNDILHKQGDISRTIINDLTQVENNWGIKIISVQIKDISFDESMKRAMATQAEANRQAEAKLINARADVETAKLYKEAAESYSENEVSLRLREFQLWSSVSKNPNNTIYVVPSNICDFVKSISTQKEK